jgi:hypothetical protein
MEITAVSVTMVGTGLWCEFEEFPLVTVMGMYEGYRNTESDDPDARRD